LTSSPSCQEEHAAVAGAAVQAAVQRYTDFRGDLGQPRVSLTRLDGWAEFAAVSRGLTVTLAAIALVALSVGALGVLNVSLMAVRQRVREFGLRRALGARARDIYLLVLFETTLIALLGGMAGVVVALVVTQGMAGGGSSLSGGLPVRPVSPLVVILSLLAAGLAGVLAGLPPAARARRLTILDTLRR
jgi:putative ABC transport system permease protein